MGRINNKVSIWTGTTEKLWSKKLHLWQTHPPCGESVVFQISDPEDGQVGALFVFDASDVQAMAEKMVEADPHTVGLRGAAKWASLRNPNNDAPTPVPPILMTFNQIAFKLIELGKGRVKCLPCEQIYETQILVEGHRREGGFCSKTYACPKQHELISTVVMHLFLRRDY